MSVMGQFTVTVTLHAPNGGTARTVEALVDTGAGYSMFPRPLLEALGCQPIRSQRVVLADGRMEVWSLSQVDVEYEGRRAPTPVLMGPPDSPVLLGATTLEELGLGVDPVNRRLVPVDIRIYLASSARGALSPHGLASFARTCWLRC
jgi:clan AA aspartic protease